MCKKAREGEIRYSKKTGAEYILHLVAAHLDLHDEANENPRLMCMCPSCHAIFDMELRRLEAEIEHEIRLHQILIKRREGILKKIGKVQRYRRQVAA